MSWFRRHYVVSLIAVMVVAVAAAWVGRMLFQPGPLAFAGGSSVALQEYTGASPVGVPAELASADDLTKGKYLTEAADCAACHTAPGGKPYAGGFPFKLPFGTIYTPNITPDTETGIGSWTDAQFLRAMHEGIAEDGSRLYPAFPYASYTLLADADVLLIRRYLASLSPVRQENLPNTFVFPFNQRWLMAIWSAFFNSNERFQPIPERSPEWNRGAYLAEAAAHCGECHTPRNLMQAMDQRSKFAGGVAEGWNAYNITADPQSGVGAWTDEALADYLATGHAAGHGTASGPMGQAVGLSLSKMTPGDIAAMVAYLKTIPPVVTGEGAVATAFASPSPAEGPSGDGLGKHIFSSACASCHAWSGKGAVVDLAELAGDRAVNDVTANNVVMMILHGTGTPSTVPAYMPSFGSAYSDAEIAAVANYVTARFGAEPSHVTAKEVARLRDQ